MKFYSSGTHSEIMPSGHMEHALPRQNFQAKAAPQVSATVPPPGGMGQQQAIIAALRNGGVNGATSPMMAKPQSKIVNNPNHLPRASGFVR